MIGKEGLIDIHELGKGRVGFYEWPEESEEPVYCGPCRNGHGRCSEVTSVMPVRLSFKVIRKRLAHDDPERTHRPRLAGAALAGLHQRDGPMRSERSRPALRSTAHLREV